MAASTSMATMISQISCLPLLRRRAIVLFFAFFISVLMVGSLWAYPASRDLIGERMPSFPGASSQTQKPPSHAGGGGGGGGDHHAAQLELPPEYSARTKSRKYCDDRFTVRYLEGLRDSAFQHCDGPAEGEGGITCFHARMDSRIDPMCIGRSAAYDPVQQRFELPCRLRGVNESDSQRGVLPFTGLTSYWYDTGPGWLVRNFVRTREPSRTTSGHEAPAPANYTILLKREGATNVWHCLMEIFSLYLTLDVLRISRDDRDGSPFFSLDDAANTRIVVLDDLPDGPYFALWTLFSKRPVVRLHEIRPESEGEENMIIPLAGAGNPTWQGGDFPHGCRHNELLQAFASRVRSFYGIGAEPEEEEDAAGAGAGAGSITTPSTGKIRVTFVDRRDTRRLVGSDEYLEEARRKFPRADIEAVDFATIGFEEQVRTAWETDVLVGVHGAGLTHAMFMRPGSALAEISPKNGGMAAFQNVANMMGLGYFGTHASDMPKKKKTGEDKAADGKGGGGGGNATVATAKREWHFEDVYLEKERFMDLLDMAIKSMYGTSGRHIDVN